MNELALTGELTPAKLFSEGGIHPLLETIEAEARAFSADITTEAGRKEIKSFAHKVARSKTLLDDAGKDIVSEWKKSAALVDADRKEVRDRLDALKAEVRKPLTDWENEKEAAIEGHKIALQRVQNLAEQAQTGWQTVPAGWYDEVFNEFKEISERDWDEFSFKAKTEIDEAKIILADSLTKRTNYDKEQEELAELRKKEAEREQKEREEQIRKDAAEKARKEVEAEAEKKLKAERDKAEFARKENEVERQRLVAKEQAAHEARVKIIQAEKDEADNKRKQAEERQAEAQKKATNARSLAKKRIALALDTPSARGLLTEAREELLNLKSSNTELLVGINECLERK